MRRPAVSMVCTLSEFCSLPHTKSNWGFHTGLGTGLQPGSACRPRERAHTPPPAPRRPFRHKTPGSQTDHCPPPRSAVSLHSGLHGGGGAGGMLWE